MEDGAECFVSGTAAGVTPVESITHKGKTALFNGGKTGELSAHLRDTLKEFSMEHFPIQKAGWSGWIDSVALVPVCNRGTSKNSCFSRWISFGTNLEHFYSLSVNRDFRSVIISLTATRPGLSVITIISVFNSGQVSSPSPFFWRPSPVPRE
jgi:hypothetical protein